MTHLHEHSCTSKGAHVMGGLLHQFHHLTHEHSFARNGAATIRMCHPRLTKRVYVFFQPWEGALWERIESASELSARLEVEMPGSADSEG